MQNVGQHHQHEHHQQQLVEVLAHELRPSDQLLKKGCHGLSAREMVDASWAAASSMRVGVPGTSRARIVEAARSRAAPRCDCGNAKYWSINGRAYLLKSATNSSSARVGVAAATI